MQPRQQMPACRAGNVWHPIPPVPEVIIKPLQQAVCLIEFARMADMSVLFKKTDQSQNPRHHVASARVPAWLPADMKPAALALMIAKLEQCGIVDQLDTEVEVPQPDQKMPSIAGQSCNRTVRESQLPQMLVKLR